MVLISVPPKQSIKNSRLGLLNNKRFSKHISITYGNMKAKRNSQNNNKNNRNDVIFDSSSWIETI
jgi:hypothetical protein